MKSFAIAVLLTAALAIPCVAIAGEHQSRFYVIETDLPAERAAVFGRALDAAGLEYHRMFRGFRGKVRQKPRVRVYATKEEYHAASEGPCGGSTANSRGFFCHSDQVMYTYDGEGIERILRHECFHQFVYNVVGGRLPKWTNEGLAEYFEEGVVDEKTGRLSLGKVPHWRLKALRAAREDGRWIPVDRLLKINGRTWRDALRRGEAQVQYSEAWLLCHFLIHADRGKYTRLFDAYLSLLDQKRGGLSSFKRVFGDDFAPLEQKLVEYLDGLTADDAEDSDTEASKVRR